MGSCSTTSRSATTSSSCTRATAIGLTPTGVRTADPREIEQWAHERNLPFFDGHVHFPDLRLEYEWPLVAVRPSAREPRSRPGKPHDSQHISRVDRDTIADIVHALPPVPQGGIASIGVAGVRILPDTCYRRVETT